MNHKGTFWIILGVFLIICAFFLTGYNVSESIRAENQAMETVKILEESADTADAEKPLVEEMALQLNEDREMPVKTVNGYDYIGFLKIPVLDVEVPVISQWDYAALKIASCRYRGSVYQKNMIVCAHNYASHFGGLKNLHIGDEIIFCDIDGNEFVYQVAEIETLQANAVEEIQEGIWDLTLFTCTVGGEKRVTVRCEQL